MHFSSSSLYRKNCVIHTIFPMRPWFLLSATILCSLKPSPFVILSAFLFVTNLNVWATKFYQSMTWSQNLFCMPSTTEAILYLYIYRFFFLQKSVSIFFLNHLFDQFNMTSNIRMLVNIESSFGLIFFLVQKHSNLFSHTYGFSHVFWYMASIGILLVNKRLNLKLKILVDPKYCTFYHFCFTSQ